MSADEQMAVIGRLMTERAEAKREQALLMERVRDLASKMSQAGSTLTYNLGEANQLRARPLLQQLAQAGGVDAVGTLLEDYNKITARIGEIESTLRAAGIQP